MENRFSPDPTKQRKKSFSAVKRKIKSYPISFRSVSRPQRIPSKQNELTSSEASKCIFIPHNFQIIHTVSFLLR